jgi:hypothetical protein
LEWVKATAIMVTETATLDTWDIVTIVLYFAIVMVVGIVVSIDHFHSFTSDKHVQGPVSLRFRSPLP